MKIKQYLVDKCRESDAFAFGFAMVGIILMLIIATL